MIGWNKAKSPKQPHVPLKQLEMQLLRLNRIIDSRASQNAKLKGAQKTKDNWWREHDKVPYSVLQKRAGRLANIVKERQKNPKAWNGQTLWKGSKAVGSPSRKQAEVIGRGIKKSRAQKK